MEYNNIIHNHGVLLMRKQEHTKYRGRREERITLGVFCEHTESPTCTKNGVVAEEFQRQLYACSHLRTYAPIKSAPQCLPTWIYWRLTQPSCPTVSHWLPYQERLFCCHQPLLLHTKIPNRVWRVTCSSPSFRLCTLAWKWASVVQEIPSLWEQDSLSCGP